MVLHFPVLHFLALTPGPTNSGPAFPALTFGHAFSDPACSGPAFSASPTRAQRISSSHMLND